jgi:hypothetical protein
MRSLILVILLAVSASVVLGQTAGNLAWKKFTPPEGHLSVSFPGPTEPKSEITTTPDAKTGPYTTYLYSVVADGTIYMVAWVDYSPTFRFNVQQEIGLNRDNFAKGIKGKVVSETPYSFGAHPGTEFVTETDSSTARSRVFVVGRRPYMLIVVNSKGRDNSANIDRFFSSFRLNSK